jgi:succinyl-CoA synthetase beta subunit
MDVAGMWLVMDLLEYQAKDLFRSVGIPVLPSQTIAQVRDLKDLTVPYPVVLKSQVYVGGRGRLGGVRFVENTIDGIAAAQAIFNLPIGGEYPRVLLAEAKYDADQEFYLAVTLNTALRRLVLLGSTAGGMAVQSVAAGQMHQVVVEGVFSPFLARQLGLAMGLTGELLQRVSEVVERMYGLLLQKDLDLVEINPLGVRGGEVMALDGKITVNDAALARHPDLVAWRQQTALDGGALPQMPLLVPTQEPAATLGILANGSGLLLATVDQVVQAGAGRPSCYVNIGGETQVELTIEQFRERLYAGLWQLTQQRSVQRVLVNLITGIVPGAVVWEVLTALDQVLPPLAAGEVCPDEIWLCWAGLPLPVAELRLSRLAVTVYDDLAAVIAALVADRWVADHEDRAVIE